MGKNYMVIGLGRLGTSIVKELSLHTKDIIGVDVDEACVNQVSEYIEQCFVCDSTKKEFLRKLVLKISIMLLWQLVIICKLQF